MNQNFKNSIIFWLIPVLLISFWYFREIVLSFLVGIILGLTIQTFALFLNYKFKLNYYLNVLLIYAFLILIISLTFYLTLRIIIDELPSLFYKLNLLLKQIGFFDMKILKEWQNFLALGSDYLPNILKFIYKFFGGFLSLILIFVISIYVALNKNFPQEIFTLFPNSEEYVRLWRKVKRKISFWIFGQLFLMIFVGLATYIFLGPILKIQYASLLGLLAGLLEVVPILGPTISLIVISVITYLEKPDLIFFVIAYFLLLQQFENHLLVPLVMKRAVEINPLLVILGIVIGGKIGGILGIIIILPTLGIITEIFNYFKFSKDKSILNHKTLIQ